MRTPSSDPEMYLGGNQLGGPLPSKFWQCKELYILALEFNNFTGHIPQNIANLTNIRTLSLGENKLTGGLSSTFGLGVPNLESLLLYNNDLSGSIPKSISNASQLLYLQLGGNHFSGIIPNTLGDLKKLQWLSLEYNNLSMESYTLSTILTLPDLGVCSLQDNPLNTNFPSSIRSNISTSLEKLVLRASNLRGNIPTTIENLISLILLRLEGNRLSGSIPSSIGRLHKIQGLYLNNNKLHGPVPSKFCQLQSLYALNLGNNILSGRIPSCLGNTTSLRELNLESNEFTSKIPPTLWAGLQDILYVDLSRNFLTGSLMPDIGNLRAVTFLNVSNNQLSGNISSTIGSLDTLASLSLANNKFQGSIPESFGSLISLESLDLSNTNLSGAIPKSLEKLSHLKFLNLSFNKLHGEIPSGGPFKNFSIESFIENYDLCGESRLQVPSCQSKIRKSNKLLVLRYIIPCILVGVFMLVIFIIVLHRKMNKKPDSEVALVASNLEALDKVTRKRVTRVELSTATNGFKEENLLGIGSFSSVYKGTLSDGSIVAIKVFNLEVEEAFESFATECQVLCGIFHRNLVKIVTCCSSPDFKALVLQYMPRGSLEKWLYSNDGFFLNILQRLNIMIDVASALEYLHYGYSTPIVHCDLKPGNVLLDENMVAHVADFGIAKLLCGQDSMTRTMTLATIGYMAPEYGVGGVVSRKGDVYSFGIMLMEVFTKKKPVDEFFSEEITLKQWVQNSLPHSITEVIDPDLLSHDDKRYLGKNNSICSILELALACSASSPEERINIKGVITTLNKIKMKYFRNDNY